MNKKDMIKKIARVEGITLAQAGRNVDSVFEQIAESVDAGEDVEIYGFGKFKLTERAAREGRNPLTGVQMTFAAKRGIKFAPSKTIKNRLN